MVKRKKKLAKLTVTLCVTASFPRTPGVGNSLETVKFILK